MSLDLSPRLSQPLLISFLPLFPLPLHIALPLGLSAFSFLSKAYTSSHSFSSFAANHSPIMWIPFKEAF